MEIVLTPGYRSSYGPFWFDLRSNGRLKTNAAVLERNDEGGRVHVVFKPRAPRRRVRGNSHVEQEPVVQ